MSSAWERLLGGLAATLATAQLQRAGAQSAAGTPVQTGATAEEEEAEAPAPLKALTPQEQRLRGEVQAEVSAITDVTPIPHNGCRPPKRRRV